jgi:hypothetical protein
VTSPDTLLSNGILYQAGDQEQIGEEDNEKPMVGLEPTNSGFTLTNMVYSRYSMNNVPM